MRASATVYFTCSRHTKHLLEDGTVWDNEGIVKVTARTYEDAVGYMVRRFTMSGYACDYPDTQVGTLLGNSPKGIVASFTHGMKEDDPNRSHQKKNSA